MSEMPTIFMQKYWPSPKEAPRVRIELRMEKAKEGKQYDYYAEVHLPDGSFRGTGGSVEARNKNDAEARVSFKLVELLGSMLADATEGMERR